MAAVRQPNRSRRRFTIEDGVAWAPRPPSMSLSRAAALCSNLDEHLQDDRSCHKCDGQGEIFDVTVNDRIKTGPELGRLSLIDIVGSRSSILGQMIS
ncbi:hypothetical protein ES703_26979 [subsurface metagenome]